MFRSKSFCILSHNFKHDFTRNIPRILPFYSMHNRNIIEHGLKCMFIFLDLDDSCVRADPLALKSVLCFGLHTTSTRHKIISGDGPSGIRGGGNSGFDKSPNTGLSGGNGNNKDKNFLCPNCGNVCTQIEEFLCKFLLLFTLQF